MSHFRFVVQKMISEDLHFFCYKNHPNHSVSLNRPKTYQNGIQSFKIVQSFSQFTQGQPFTSFIKKSL